MRVKPISRWTGVGRASVAVAGVCLTGSVASAFTTTRAADFETEFESDKALESAAPAVEAPQSVEGQAVEAQAPILAVESVASVWEETLVTYLDKLASRECDECEKALAKDTNPDWDIDEPLTAVAEANPDWDLEESPVVLAEIKDDSEVEEAPVVAASVDPDWDLEEPTVITAEVDPDWDLAEPEAVAAAIDPDWDIAEPAADEAVAATAQQSADAAPRLADEENPDWDLDDTTVAAAPAGEVTKLNPADEELDLFP